MSSLVSLHGKRRASVVLTPERPPSGAKRLKGKVVEDTKIDEVDEVEEAIQEYYEHAVDFQRSAPALTPSKSKVVKYIKANYTVPADFTVNKARWGPLAGQSLDQRLLIAYDSGKLTLKQKGKALLLCLDCAEEGHRAKDCPAALS